MQFVKTLKGELINLEQISHVSASGTSGMVSVGGSVVVITMDEFAELEKTLDPQQLVEPPPPPPPSGAGQSESSQAEKASDMTTAPDAADPTAIAEAQKRTKPSTAKKSK